MRTQATASQAVIVMNEKVLLVKQEENGKIFWNFPGGRVEEGETVDLF